MLSHSPYRSGIQIILRDSLEGSEISNNLLYQIDIDWYGFVEMGHCHLSFVILDPKIAHALPAVVGEKHKVRRIITNLR